MLSNSHPSEETLAAQSRDSSSRHRVSSTHQQAGIAPGVLRHRLLLPYKQQEKQISRVHSCFVRWFVSAVGTAAEASAGCGPQQTQAGALPGQGAELLSGQCGLITLQILVGAEA